MMSSPSLDSTHPRSSSSSSSLFSSDDAFEGVPSEVRRYQVPKFIVEHERQMLKEYGTESLQRLLDRVYFSLSATVVLMQHYDQDTCDEKGLIQMLGDNLSFSLHVLGKIRSLATDFTLQPEPQLI